MSKQDITLTVILHLFKDWARDHKISLSKPFSIWLCFLDTGNIILYRVCAPKPWVCTARTGVVLQRFTEDSAVINTNYAESYHCVQRSFVLTHQAIFTHQNIMQRRKLIAMIELVQKLSQTSPEPAKRQFAKFPTQSRARKQWDYYTCCGGPRELFLLLCNQ